MLSDASGTAPGQWRFRTAPGGKPELDPAHGRPELRFSLSHTRGMVACAVGHGGDLGVDVEAGGSPVPVLETARRFFAPDEAALIARQPPEQQADTFYRLWTLKEAYVKATGQGISAPLKDFCFSLAPPTISFGPGQPDHPDAWQFAELRPGPRHWLALAIRRPASDSVRLDIATITPDDCLKC